MEKELPTINIEGTEFLVDVDKFELREKENQENIISVFDMRDLGNGKGYLFHYSTTEKNIPYIWNREGTVTVEIPEMIALDPEGMSKKYGVPLEMFTTKTDFDLMVNQEALEERLGGRLPTIDIAGHTFYVDLQMDMLRPKDDFISRGIEFSKVEDYFVDDQEKYWVPYNPKTHEFQEFDFSKVTEIPKDIIIISFPNQSTLDPIGYNRKHGFADTFNLKAKNLKSHFKAGHVAWNETGIEAAIKDNKVRSLKNEVPNPPKLAVKKGRKL